MEITNDKDRNDNDTEQGKDDSAYTGNNLHITM